MDQPARNLPTIRLSSRLRSPAVWALLAMSLVLTLVGRSVAGLEADIVLSTGKPTVEAFLFSPLYYRHWTLLVPVFAVILFVGGSLESRWGTPRFTLFCLLTAWGSNWVTLVIGIVLDQAVPTFGSGGVALGLLVAAGSIFPDHRLTRYAPPARHLVWIVILLGGALLGFLGHRAGDFLLPQVSGVPLGLAFLTIDPLVFRFLAARRKQRFEQERRRAQELRLHVDVLLEKISTQGYPSLTRHEKSFLERASKHYRSEP